MYCIIIIKTMDRLHYFIRSKPDECYRLSRNKYIFSLINKQDENKCLDELPKDPYGIIIVMTGKKIYEYFGIVPKFLEQIYFFVDIYDHINHITEMGAPNVDIQRIIKLGEIDKVYQLAQHKYVVKYKYNPSDSSFDEIKTNHILIPMSGKDVFRYFKIIPNKWTDMYFYFDKNDKIEKIEKIKL